MELIFAYQEWPYKEVFRISRSDNSTSNLFVVWLKRDGYVGRGECSILSQYGHTAEDLKFGFDDAARRLMSSGDLRAWVRETPNTSVRNALDCALWDLKCKQENRSIWDLTGVPFRPSLSVDLTISVNPIDKMCLDARAAAAAGYSLLKLKANADQVVEKVAAIAKAVPGAKFIVDANEAWDLQILRGMDADLHALGVVLIEQPLHHTSDEGLRGYRGPIPICADESCHAGSDLADLSHKYQAINIKLDKVGGLTGGLEMARAAKSLGMGLMLGCGGPTSLGVAPAYVIATLADFVDLDGPALMLDDRAFPVQYRDGRLHAFSRDLWG